MYFNSKIVYGFHVRTHIDVFYASNGKKKKVVCG